MTFSGGTVTYTPDAGYVGADTFEYIISDQTDGLAHDWQLNGDLRDSVGSVDGSANNGPTTIAGHFGEALNFDGVNDSVSVADLAYNNSYTISFYFKVDDNSGTGLQYSTSHGDGN